MNQQLPRGIRNNNPGNIRHGANWLGLNPNGRNIDSGFCVFTAPVYGIRALAKVLVNYKRIHGLNTVRQIVSRYAPPNENQTTAYIQSVAKQLGVYPDTVIDIEERGVLTVFIKAVIRMENGIQPYSDELIQQGIDLLTRPNRAFFMKGINMLRLIELLKLNQPSTWRGLISLLSGLGVAISPELIEHIVALAVSAFGIVEIVRSEKTGK